MGWTFSDSWRTRDAAIADAIEGMPILGRSNGRGLDVEWVAVDRGSRFVVAILIERQGNTYGYKLISEFEGPFYYDCPARVLALTDEPAAHETSAIAWRAKVRA